MIGQFGEDGGEAGLEMEVKETKKVNMAQVYWAQKEMIVKEVHKEKLNKKEVKMAKEINIMEEEKEEEEKIV
jgi:predicted metal-dependent TIM-barrel fold hydrolase